jgi:opacity protein-like surface antigen
LYLFNVYADLGTWGGVTPFVGAGIGFSRIGIHSFRDAGIANGAPTLGYADSDYKWNVAYAFHAGLAYEVTRNMTLEFAYRYVYLGDGQSGECRSQPDALQRHRLARSEVRRALPVHYWCPAAANRSATNLPAADAEVLMQGFPGAAQSIAPLLFSEN